MTRVNIILAQSYMQRKPWVSDSLMLVHFSCFLSKKLEVWNLGSSSHNLLLTPTPQNFFHKHSQGIPGMLSTNSFTQKCKHDLPTPSPSVISRALVHSLENRNRQQVLSCAPPATVQLLGHVCAAITQQAVKPAPS